MRTQMDRTMRFAWLHCGEQRERVRGGRQEGETEERQKEDTILAAGGGESNRGLESNDEQGSSNTIDNGLGFRVQGLGFG
jgi:hypothetical protein